MAQNAGNIIVDIGHIKRVGIVHIAIGILEGQILHASSLKINPGQGDGREELRIDEVRRCRDNGRSGGSSILIRFELHQLVEVLSSTDQLALIIAVRRISGENFLGLVHSPDNLGDILALHAIISGEGSLNKAIADGDRRRDAIKFGCIEQPLVAISPQLLEVVVQSIHIVNLPVDGANHEGSLVLNEGPQHGAHDIVGIDQSLRFGHPAIQVHQQVIGVIGDEHITIFRIGIHVQTEHEIVFQAL